ncbi:RagB/SusD family nutrient uptake outer membrane protein [Pseudobacter ginsenosidimutans]|uniref:SusD-like starch-binding protein associating with outer membrane n=1 Tax=Pseudobacter ginsenosidimutans TaxID=661488 RepID=A0A4Q7MKY2_9BACT|nr:RagB/SusD family nutrient uptake outer membrane protein [Pseudobacter ginsenosidimutans]QEC40390.1 RagB/SusD family nutrient uptake outer membrane protein [Pseudobacter ginsenosidimutans]RZS69005.1 SusD-like starch-binding protein associating with outer membrane [Pseudobacter ginsenosidimutans]
MRKQSNLILRSSIYMLLAVSAISCNKLVEVDEPIDSITAKKMYKNETQAETALAGVYYELINGYGTRPDPFLNSFAAGLSVYTSGLSSDEFNVSSANKPAYALAISKVTLTNYDFVTRIWNSAYHTIYNANAVIEGIADAKNSSMRDSVKVQYTAEAKFLRAFCYFNLVNYFGELPIALTTDFNQTKSIARSSVQTVYAQILSDLQDAERDLPAHYEAGKMERIRANSWVAKAMLAKVHLYMGNYPQAAAKASELIAQPGTFQMVPLSDVFLAPSKEAIFQLKQTNQGTDFRNATPQGFFFIPNDRYKDGAQLWLTDQLISAFEAGDQRWEIWTDSTMQSNTGTTLKVWYPTKYKTGRYNAVLNAPSPEYTMVLRLAEMYLIRAEARANGADGGHTKAIEDLNAVRLRTGLDGLSMGLDIEAVKEAVAHERQIELFAEGGNRWFDLKRTGKASALLSSMPAKQPWEGDYQLLYPIPVPEIEANRNILQNNGYIR